MLRPLCPASREEPAPCDCGYVGPWLMRFWKKLQPCPPTSAYWHEDGGSVLVKRCADCKSGGDGHLLYAGWEERCPRCGDVERFTFDGALVAQERNPAYFGTRDYSLDDDGDVWALLGMDDAP